MIKSFLKYKKVGGGLLLGAAFFLIFSGIFWALAAEDAQNSTATEESSDANLEADIQGKEEKLKEIESKIEAYENLVDLKQKQQASLSNQLELMDNQVKGLEEKIAKSEEELDLVELEIKKLEIQIKEKDIDIEYRKKILSELMRQVYHNSRASTLELLLKYDNLGEYFTGMESLNTLNGKVGDVLDEINQAKLELQAKREERESRFDEIKRIKNESLQNKSYLESEQVAKSDLLEETKGEEEKYQELLERFQAQRETILGDIDNLSGEKSGELARVKAKQEKPKKGLASTSWYFSQHDSRWGNKSIGVSNTKMANYGCAVTCVAMVLRYHGVSINPGTLAKQRIFYYDLIVWPSKWQNVERVSSISHGNIDWDRIDKELEDGNPVIVFIRANGKGAGHYVVVHHKAKDGDYVVHDPYWGSNIYLSSTRAYISTLYGSSTSIDQMIIYEGDGSESKDEDDDPKALCEKGNHGDWDNDDEECNCDSGYELDGGECVEN